MKCTWALLLMMCGAWVNSMKIHMAEDSALKKDSVPISPSPRYRDPPSTPITRIPRTAPDQDTKLNKQDQYVLNSPPLRQKGLRGTPASHFPHNAVKQANKDDIKEQQGNQYLLKNSTSATVDGWWEQQVERKGLNCVCGLSKMAGNGRIVNGWEVHPKNNYKWQVGLSGANSQYFCGGSIINDYYVLTASHCVTNSNYKCYKPSEVYVGVGDHNMYSKSDNTKYTTKLKVQKIICHPHYNPANYDNDIALLKLERRLDIVHPPIVGSICLPSGRSKNYAYFVGTASGWGKLQTHGQQPGPLQEMDLPILPSSCWGYEEFVTKNQLCTFAVWGDTCQGDSGGPLSVRTSDNHQYTQVGITSFSFGKCDNGKTPTIFTNVSMYVNWIMANTYDAGYCRTY